jgi:hypothetical protein
MWLPDQDPLEPTKVEKHKALQFIAMVVCALFAATVLGDQLGLDFGKVWHGFVVGVFVLLIFGPRDIAYFRNMWNGRR